MFIQIYHFRFESVSTCLATNRVFQPVLNTDSHLFTLKSVCHVIERINDDDDDDAEGLTYTVIFLSFKRTTYFAV